MNVLFSIHAVPPTQDLIDVARARIDRRLKKMRQTRLLVVGLAGAVASGASWWLWVPESGWTLRAIVAGFSALLAAAGAVEVMYELTQRGIDAMRALSPVDRAEAERMARLAEGHVELGRYLSALDGMRPITNREYEIMRQFIDNAQVTAHREEQRALEQLRLHGLA